VPTRLRAQLWRWRRPDRGLRFHTRAIIEVEEVGDGQRRAPRQISREKS